MEARNTAKYVNVLSDLLFNYNNSYHASIKTTPNKANAHKVKSEETQRMAQVNEDNDEEDFYLEEGAEVRRLKPKKLFDKGAQQYFKGTYTIHKKNRQSFILKN